MHKQKIIYISESVEDIPVSYFPISNNLMSFFRKEKIKLLGDLRGLQLETIEQIQYNKKKPFSELKQFIFSVQENDSSEIFFSDKEISDSAKNEDIFFDEEDDNVIEDFQPISTINELIDLFNNFTNELENDKDRAIFLGRMGGISDELIPMTEICGRYKVSLDFISQNVTAIINEIRSYIGQDGSKVLEKLHNECLEKICLLTPEFLVYLTNNDYVLFQYPPAFYIRIIGKLSPRIPTLPEYKVKAKKLEKDALRMSKQIKKVLKGFAVPLTLAEVYNRVIPISSLDQNLVEIFFEAVQSMKFSLIKADNPTEVYIEVIEKRVL